MSKVQDQCQRLASTTEVSDKTNAIIGSFRALLKEPNNLDIAVNYLYETLLDDATIGICMETHHLQKTGILPALDGIAEVPRGVYQMHNFDIFGISTEYKSINCPCPNCDRMVAAARFAPHLQSCMGLGRSSSRTALRRRTTSFCSSGGDFDNDDDDGDVDWCMNMHKRKSTKSSRNNASKKINDNIY